MGLAQSVSRILCLVAKDNGIVFRKKIRGLHPEEALHWGAMYPVLHRANSQDLLRQAPTVLQGQLVVASPGALQAAENRGVLLDTFWELPWLPV